MKLASANLFNLGFFSIPFLWSYYIKIKMKLQYLLLDVLHLK